MLSGIKQPLTQAFVWVEGLAAILMIENFEIKGEWKYARCDEWLKGSLTYNTETGALLILHGTFNPFLFEKSSKEIIFGKTTDGEVTLIDTWYIKSTTHNQTEITVSKYRPSIILVGHLFDSNKSLNFNRVKFKLFNLFNWFALTGKSVDLTKDVTGYSVKYERVPEITFSLNDNCNGKFSFTSRLNSDSRINKSEISEEASITLEYNKATNYKLIIDDIFKFVRLITLFTYEQSYPISIIFENNKLKKKESRAEYIKSINCIYQNSSYNKNHKVKMCFEHLVKYENVSNILPEILKKWFQKSEEIEDVIILLVNFFKNKYRFSSATFMDCVRALESYHRSYYNNDRIHAEKFKDLVKSILKQVNLETEDNDWLKQRLMLNEPNLRIRIKDLLKRNKNKYTVSIPRVSKFCQNAITSRNYYTHYDQKLKRKALTGKELSEITQQIRGILISALLTDLGLDNEQFEDGLRYNLQ